MLQSFSLFLTLINNSGLYWKTIVSVSEVYFKQIFGAPAFTTLPAFKLPVGENKTNNAKLCS